MQTRSFLFSRSKPHVAISWGRAWRGAGAAGHDPGSRRKRPNADAMNRVHRTVQPVTTIPIVMPPRFASSRDRAWEPPPRKPQPTPIQSMIQPPSPRLSSTGRASAAQFIPFCSLPSASAPRESETLASTKPVRQPPASTGNMPLPGEQDDRSAVGSIATAAAAAAAAATATAPTTTAPSTVTKRKAPSQQFQRAYKACEPCRVRKSKCELDDSGEPPCTRCRRELRTCVFSSERSWAKRQKIDDDTAAPSVSFSFGKTVARV